MDARSFLRKLLAIIATLLVAWIALWAANIINYIISIPFGWAGAITSALADQYVWVDFLVCAITTGITMFLAFSGAFHVYAAIVDDDFYEIDWYDRGIMLLITLLIIYVGDVRLHEFDLSFLNDIALFFKEDCYFFVLGVIDWMDLNFQSVSYMQYNVFDLSVAISALWISIFGCWWD